MVEVIVTIIVPDQSVPIREGDEFGPKALVPAHTNVHRLEFDNEADVIAWLYSGRNGIDVREKGYPGAHTTGAITVEELVGES
jgi:hypothetical protein